MTTISRALKYSLGFALCLLTAPAAQALTIVAEAHDLADSTPGTDLWEYVYHVSGYNFAGGEGFTLFFDPFLYDSLVDPTGPADWDILTLQPDPLIPDDGIFDALALLNGASLADPFAVGFTWLGVGTPGPQSFVVYDAGFTTIESGTTLTIPEPSAIFLMLLGLGAPGLGLVASRRKTTKGQAPIPEKRSEVM